MTSNNSSRKIALLVPNLTGGGAERVMVVLANEFSKNVDKVDLVIVNDNDMHYLEELSDNVNLINLGTQRLSRSIFALRKYLRAAQPDALLTTLNHVSAAAALSLAISGNVSTRLFVREDSVPKPISPLRTYHFFIDYIVKWAYQRASGVIALSEDMATEIQRHFNISTPIHTIYNPIHIDKLLTSTQQQMDPPLPWSPDNKFIVSAGRLIKGKDFNSLIKATALAREHHDVKLVILGEGPERQTLLSLASSLNMQNSLYLPGFVSNPYAFMGNAAAFVLPSEREGLPNTLIQALICGAPCISTNCLSGPREILKDGQYGRLVEVGDHEAMGQELVEILNGKSSLTPDISILRRQYESDKIGQMYLDVLLNRKICQPQI